jgi:hypothetical protein
MRTQGAQNFDPHCIGSDELRGSIGLKHPASIRFCAARLAELRKIMKKSLRQDLNPSYTPPVTH